MYQLNQQQALNYRTYTNRVRSIYQKPIAQTSSALILTLLTITFFGFAAIRPTLATVSQLVSELEQKRELDKQISEKLTTLQELQDLYLLNESKLEIFEQVIPPEHQLNQLLLKIEYLAYNDQIPLTSLRVDPLITYGAPDPKAEAASRSEINQTYSELAFRIITESEMDRLQQFLEHLYNLDRFNYIDSINFSRSQDEDTANLVTMSLDYHVFWSPSETLTPTNQP